MDSPTSEEPVIEEAPKRRARKKVELVALEGEEEPVAPAPKKRARKKLSDEESEPASIAFKSAKGDVSFSARKRAVKFETPEAPPEAPPSSPPIQRQTRAPTRVKAPPTPGFYEQLHEHLSARGDQKSQRWGQFLIA